MVLIRYHARFLLNIILQLRYVASACRIKLMFLSQLKLNGHRIFFYMVSLLFWLPAIPPLLFPIGKQ